jgi:TRAP-type uncharacterized transport system fused permease subunit
MEMNAAPISTTQADSEIEAIAKYDPEMRFRRLGGLTLKLVYAMTMVLSLFHIYTAGFGVLQEWRHRAFHLAFVLPLVFFLYAMRKEAAAPAKSLLYDLGYSVLGATLITTIFRELLSLSAARAVALALLACVLLH